MEMRAEIREFLSSRRARLKAADVGLPDVGPRRVPGLRREEVAVLAGVSVPYYTRMERGDLAGASEGVLDALARALRLDDAERTHLFDLARAAQPLARPPRRHEGPAQIRPHVQQILDAMTGGPAQITNRRHDVIGVNALARALFRETFEAPGQANGARYALLDPRAREFFVDWEQIAPDIVASLRTAVGRNPDDQLLAELIAELQARSEEFRRSWARHDVRIHVSGVKRFRHPEVGELTLNYQCLAVPQDPDLTLLVYTAEPASRSAEALALLGTLAAAC